MKAAVILLVCFALAGCAVTPAFSTYEVPENELTSSRHSADRRTLFQLPSANIKLTPVLSFNQNDGSWRGDITITHTVKGTGPFYAARGASGAFIRTNATFDVAKDIRVLKSIGIKTEDLLLSRIPQIANLVAGAYGLNRSGTATDPIKVIGTFPAAGVPINLDTFVDKDRGVYPSDTEVTAIKVRSRQGEEARHSGWSYTVEFADKSPTSQRMSEDILALGSAGVFFHPSCRQVTVTLIYNGSDRRLGEIPGPIRMTAAEARDLPVTTIVRTITVPDPYFVELIAMPAEGAVAFTGCQVTVSNQKIIERDPIAIGQSLLDAHTTISEAIEKSK